MLFYLHTQQSKRQMFNTPFNNNMNNNMLPLHGVRPPMHMNNNLNANFNNLQNVPGYSQQPSRNTPISVDDIILALQNVKDAKIQLQQQVENYKACQPKPIDLNRTNTSYIVCHKIFASGKVYQPDTPLLPDERMAKYEQDRLRRANRETEYYIRKVTWSLEDDNEQPSNAHLASFHDFPEFNDDQDDGKDPLVSSSGEEGDDESSEKRFVWN